MEFDRRDGVNSRYRFGLHEVISIVVGTLIILAAALIDSRLGWGHGQEKVLAVVIFISALFGICSGGVLALVSSVLYVMVYGEHIDPGYIFMLVLISLIVGHYAQYFDVRGGNFTYKKLPEFIVLNILVDIFAWLFFVPFMELVFHGEELFSQVDIGLERVLFMGLADLILVALLILSDLFCKSMIKEKTPQL